MNNDEKILKILESMDKRFTGIEQRLDGIEQRFTGIEQRLDGIEQEQNRTATAIEALKAGQEDIRAKMATKQDLAHAVNTAKKELRNEIEVSRADAKSDSLRILGKLDKQNSRIENLEKATGTPNPHKN